MKIVYSPLAWSKSNAYLTDFTGSGYGPDYRTAAHEADKILVTASGLAIQSDFLDTIEARDERGILLLEVRKATTKPLELVVKRPDDTIVLQVKLPLKTSGVEKMFRHVNMAALVADKNGHPLKPEVVPSRIGEPENYPDDLTNGKYFVFIHGYSVTQELARGWHAETFKRLHQLGSKARFVGVTWNGDTGLDYHQAVKHAFITGSQLNEALSFLSGDVTIAAHSLGNMVVSSAIAGGGFAPARYYMINAAVPIEAYDSGQTQSGTIDMRGYMTEDGWKTYLPNGDKLFANGWHTLFTDARSTLSWADRLRGALSTTTYNFYSTGEDVVENPNANETVSQEVWDALVLALTQFERGRHAWVTQEMAKGSSHPFIVAGMGIAHGGWSHNMAYTANPPPLDWQVLPVQEALNLSQDALRIEPFFGKFQIEDDLFGDYQGDALYGPDNNGTAGDMAQKVGTQYKLLAEAIPARSFAAAANEVTSLNQLGPNNINMMDMKNDRQWPPERLGGFSGTDWLHSDFRAVALLYTYPVWKEMIDLGALDQCDGC